MDNLQWFKFSPSDWMMGRIQRQPAQVQVDFLRVCCQYWKNEGNYSIEDAQLECMDSYDVLVKFKIIKESNNHIQIDFLDEQLDAIESKRQQASEAGKRSAESRKRKSKPNDRSTTVKQPFNEPSTESNRVEKSRVDKEKSRVDIDKNVPAIPTLEQFIDYGLEQASKHRLNVNRTSLSMKYEAWKLNGWVNGNGKPINNWKSSLINTLKYIQETENGKPKEYQSEKDMQAAQIMKELKRQALEESLYGNSQNTTEPTKRIGDE